MEESFASYEEWLKIVPDFFTSDPLWHMKSYRFALFVGDLGWPDVTKLANDSRTIALSNQLYRSLGSISANMTEGYSRHTGKDRARIYGIALGSARESRDWYWKGRHVLGRQVVLHRLELLTQVIKMLTSIIPNERKLNLSEERAEYVIEGESELD
jgi:four helix bundle protein